MVDTADDLGPYAARLEAIRRAEQAQQGAEAAEEQKRLQRDRFIARFVAERVPQELKDPDERAAFAATLARMAQELSARDAPPEEWTRLRLGVAEFRKRRGYLLRRLAEQRQVHLELERIDEAEEMLPPAEEWQGVLRRAARAEPDWSNPSAIQVLEARLEALERDCRILRWRAEARDQPAIDLGIDHGIALMPAMPAIDSSWSESAPPADALSQGSDDGPVDAGPDSSRSPAGQPRTAGGARRRGRRPRVMTGVTPEVSEQRCLEILALFRKGHTVGNLAEQYGEPSSSIRRWLSWGEAIAIERGAS